MGCIFRPAGLPRPALHFSTSVHTTAEKLELMERLWVDLSRHSEDMPSPAWHGTVLDERRCAVQEGRATFIAWEEARQRLLDRHG